MRTTWNYITIFKDYTHTSETEVWYGTMKSYEMFFKVCFSKIFYTLRHNLIFHSRGGNPMNHPQLKINHFFFFHQEKNSILKDKKKYFPRSHFNFSKFPFWLTIFTTFNFYFYSLSIQVLSTWFIRLLVLKKKNYLFR